MKQVVLLVLALVLSMVLMTGCGQDNPVDNTGQDGNKDNSTTVNISDNGGTGKITEGDTEISYTKNMEDSVAIPEGYPGDIFPVYEGSFVASAAHNNDGSFVIISYTSDSVQEVADFYGEVLKDAQVMNLQDGKDQFVSMGTLKNNTYTVAVASAEEEMGYKSAITITVVPGDMLQGVGDVNG